MVGLSGKKLMIATIMNLLLIGALSYGLLPEAYCSLEDKTVKYVHMSESQKTVTKVVPTIDDEGNTNFNIMDDRCQKGREIGQWIPVKELIRLPVGVVEEVDIKRPMIIENAEYFKNEGKCFVTGNIYYAEVAECK